MKQLLCIVGFFFLTVPALQAQSDQPPNGYDELQAYSLFYESYRADNYEKALRYGAWIGRSMSRELEGYPKFNLETNLDRLITAYAEIAKEEEDSELQEAYIDTALMLFDNTFEEFSEDEIDYFKWELDKGRFYQDYSDLIEDGMAKAYEQYAKVFEMDPERATEQGDGYYVQITIQYYVSEGEKEKALEMIDEAESYASEELLATIDEARNELFDTPEERIGFLEDQLEDDPENEELLRELADIYINEEMNSEAKEVAEKLYDLDDNFENTMTLAEYASSNAEYEMAIRYYEEALEKTDDEEELAEISMELSDAYLNEGDLQEARRYAQEAMDHDSEWGEPYLQMASIYAEAVSECTSQSEMSRRDKVVYWLVLDYLDEAREVDSSVENRVERQYSSYEGVTPTTEEKFFSDWEAGAELQVDDSLGECYSWIDETTTVR